MKRSILLHPFLFALFPILFLYSHNIEDGSVGLRHLVWPAAATLLVTALLVGIGRLGLRSWPKAALSASVVVILFFSYGHLFALVAGKSIGGLVLRDRILLPMWAALGAVLVILIARAKSRLVELTKILNVMAVIVLATTFVGIGQGAARAFSENPRGPMGPGTIGLVPSTPPRDIYYLIFDRYAGGRTLLEEYGFDNRPFLDELERRGFFVAKDSGSNYPTTYQSLAASLNMEYLDYITATAGEDSTDWGFVAGELREGIVGKSLKQAGYKFVHIGSWWQPTYDSPLADVTLQYRAASYFTRTLLETSAYRPVGDRLGWFDDRLARRRVAFRTAQYQFDAIEKSHAIPGPKFVFAHILQPHDPYVFDSAGHFVSFNQERERSRTRNYLEQVNYTNTSILDFLNTLLEGDSSTHPIVIMHAEEGPFPERYEQLFTDFAWKAATDAEIKFKFPIFNAYYFPGVQDHGLYESITPVNTFRSVFNNYFGTDLPLLRDRNYVFEDFSHIYKFLDVTERVGLVP